MHEGICGGEVTPDGASRIASEAPRKADGRSRRLVIVDPGRRFGCDADRQFSDLVARAFSDGGFEVVWVVDADDPLTGTAYAELRRLLPLRQGPGPRETSPTLSIGRLDGWARASWKAPRSSPAVKAVALAAWAFVRVLYRLQYATAVLAWCRSCIPRLLARLHCRMHGRFRFGWRIGSWLARVLAPVPTAAFAKDGDAALAAAAGEAASPQAEFVELIECLGTEDVILLPSARLPHFEMLFQLLPRLGLSRPFPTTLHVRFAHGGCPAGDPGHDKGAMLALRLRSGSPIRTIVFHAQTAEQRRGLERSLGLRVHECHGDRSWAALRRRFAPARGSTVAAQDVLDVQPSLVVDELGPLVLLISALWGRVGSSTIFDAQTRYLLERGFVVARILIDHHPQKGAERGKRIERLLAENFENVRPHLHFVAERDDSFGNLWRLASAKEFCEGSPVRRIGMLLATATIDDPAAAAWCANRAVVAVVNHLPHVAFAERLAKAPIVLETHDIYAKLLTTHGIPGFVPRRPDGDRRRQADEADVWRRVAACVNLSPEDHALVAPVAKRSALARPYVDRRALDTRSWLDVVEANGLPADYRSTCRFDIMLWGDWHEGNVAGVRWFLERVAGEHSSLRQASILLVGRVAKGLPRRLLQRQGLYAAGFVDRIDDFFARSAVLVIPDQPGSTGISVKAIDALARGCCFASTAAGLRGVDLGDTGLAPSNDPAALALDIASLLESPDARRARATAARRLYALNFSKAAYSNAWDAGLHSLLAGLPGSTASGPQAFPNGHVALPPLPPGERAAAPGKTELHPAPAHEATPVP